MPYDLLGYDVLGDDDVEGTDDVLGAQVAPGGLRNARWAKQLRQGAPGAPAISEMMLPLGLGSTTFVFGGATSATLTAIPQLAYRGERIILSGFATISDNTADASALFEVTDIKVGQRSQLVSPQSIPAVAFTPTAFGVRLALDPAVPGIVISVSVRYIGPALKEDETATLTGTILGRAAG
jgi:hypothetical protein